MTMTPADFLTAAEKVAASASSEGDRRTAIGRAYYAAFLEAREKAGLSNTRESVHKEVADWIFAHVPGHTPQKFQSLHALRIRADYRLNDTLAASAMNDAIRYSKQVIKALGGTTV